MQERLCGCFATSIKLVSRAIALCFALMLGGVAFAQSNSPIADAGDDRIVEIGQNVSLDGTRSTLLGTETGDRPDASLAYNWSFISGPEEPALAGADTPKFKLSLPSEGCLLYTSPSPRD